MSRLPNDVNGPRRRGGRRRPDEEIGSLRGRRSGFDIVEDALVNRRPLTDEEFNRLSPAGRVGAFVADQVATAGLPETAIVGTRTARGIIEGPRRQVFENPFNSSLGPEAFGTLRRDEVGRRLRRERAADRDPLVVTLAPFLPGGRAIARAQADALTEGADPQTREQVRDLRDESIGSLAFQNLKSLERELDDAVLARQGLTREQFKELPFPRRAGFALRDIAQLAGRGFDAVPRAFGEFIAGTSGSTEPLDQSTESVASAPVSEGASIFDSLPFDPFAPDDNGIALRNRVFQGIASARVDPRTGEVIPAQPVFSSTEEGARALGAVGPLRARNFSALGTEINGDPDTPEALREQQRLRRAAIRNREEAEARRREREGGGLDPQVQIALARLGLDAARERSSAQDRAERRARAEQNDVIRLLEDGNISGALARTASSIPSELLSGIETEEGRDVAFEFLNSPRGALVRDVASAALAKALREQNTTFQNLGSDSFIKAFSFDSDKPPLLDSIEFLPNNRIRVAEGGLEFFGFPGEIVLDVDPRLRDMLLLLRATQ